MAMNHDLSLSVSQSIQASRSDVWKALTDEDKIKEYFYGTEAVSDWEVGSPIRFKGEWEGTSYEDKGMILAKKDEELLQYSYWSSMSGMEDVPQNYATVTYQLQSDGDQTALTVMQKGFKDEAACEHSRNGWKEVLNNLKALLED